MSAYLGCDPNDLSQPVSGAAAAAACARSLSVTLPASAPASASSPLPASAVAASAAEPSSASSAAVAPSTEVGAAIRAACDRLNKPFPEAAVAALQDNWYNTAAELTALPDETARSLGVPLRLKAEVAQLLAATAAPAAEAANAGSRSGSSASASDGLAAGLPLPAQTEQLLDELLDGSDSSESDADSSSSVEAAAAEAAAAAAQAAAWDQAHLPLEHRRCPPPRRFGNSAKAAPKLTSRGQAQRYALSADETSPALAAEFEAFHRFCTVRFFGAQVSAGRGGQWSGQLGLQPAALDSWRGGGALIADPSPTTPQADPISDVTARKYADHMRGLLGW